MKAHSRPLALLGFFLFSLTWIAGSPLLGQPTRAEERPIFIGLTCGYAQSERQGGMVDLRAEILFSVSRSLEFGVGLGYLTGFEQMHGAEFGGMMGGMTGGTMDSRGGISMGFDHSFRSTPLTLTAYLRRPLGYSAGVMLLGGVGYYFGSYRDISVQRKQAFGPHFGVGSDLRIARHVRAVAEVSYRFINFKGFIVDPHPGFDFDEIGHRMEGFWYFDQADDRYHFRMDDGHMEEFIRGLPSFDIRLNGFSLRAGLRLGF